MLHVLINRRRWISLPAAILIAVTGLSVVTAAPASAGPIYMYWIVNQNSVKCLNVDNASLADRAPVIQWTCQTTFTNDQWYFLPAPAPVDAVWIINRHSRKCLNVNNASVADRAPVVQWTCQEPLPNDKWSLVDMGNGFYHIVNVNSGKCLNVSNASLADRAPVVQWPCQTTFTNDSWYLVSQGWV